MCAQKAFWGISVKKKSLFTLLVWVGFQKRTLFLLLSTYPLPAVCWLKATAWAQLVHTDFFWNGSWERNELKFLASCLATKNPTNQPTNQSINQQKLKKKNKRRQTRKKNVILHLEWDHLRVGTNSSLHNKLGSPGKWAACPVIKPCYPATNKYYRTFHRWKKIFHGLLSGLGLLFLLKAKKFKNFRSFV